MLQGINYNLISKKIIHFAFLNKPQYLLITQLIMLSSVKSENIQKIKDRPNLCLVCFFARNYLDLEFFSLNEVGELQMLEAF